MTIIISFDNIKNSLRTNSSGEWPKNPSVIDNTKWSINNSPYGCTNCQGGGCGVCISRS